MVKKIQNASYQTSIKYLDIYKMLKGRYKRAGKATSLNNYYNIQNSYIGEKMCIDLREYRLKRKIWIRYFW